MKLKIILMAIVAFVFTACSEHTTQICTDNKVDVGIEGDYSFSEYDLQKFISIEHKVKVTRIEQGTYDMDGGMVYTCKAGSKTIAEQYNSKLSTFSAFLIDQDAKELRLAFAVYDAKELDEKNIPYRIVESPEKRYPDYAKYATRGFKSLLLDNYGLSSDATIQLMRPFYMKLFLTRLTKKH